MSLTDCGPNAAWRRTFLSSNPWTVDPAYSELIGFELRMIRGDLLHIFNLGIARDIIGATLKTIVKDQIVWQSPNIDDRFHEATCDLKAFARLNAHCLRLKRLTKNKISWSNKTYPEFKGSGSDAHVVAVWLEDHLAPFADHYADLCTLLWSTNRIMKILYSAGRFLCEEEMDSIRVLGNVFSQTYLRLAVDAISSHQLMYRVRPKFHPLIHVLDCHDCLNSSFYATWMDEDWLRKIARTMQLVSSKTAQKRVMERWLMAVPFNLKHIRLTK